MTKNRLLLRKIFEEADACNSEQNQQKLQDKTLMCNFVLNLLAGQENCIFDEEIFTDFFYSQPLNTVITQTYGNYLNEKMDQNFKKLVEIVENVAGVPETKKEKSRLSAIQEIEHVLQETEKFTQNLTAKFVSSETSDAEKLAVIFGLTSILGADISVNSADKINFVDGQVFETVTKFLHPILVNLNLEEINKSVNSRLLPILLMHVYNSSGTFKLVDFVSAENNNNFKNLDDFYRLCDANSAKSEAWMQEADFLKILSTSKLKLVNNFKKLPKKSIFYCFFDMLELLDEENLEDRNLGQLILSSFFELFQAEVEEVENSRGRLAQIYRKD